MPEDCERKIDLEDIEFMRQACLLCDRSLLEVRTGCVLVKNGEIIGEGWNSKPNNRDDQEHAEIMAVRRAKEKGKSLMKAVIYVSRFPCSECSQILIDEGISQVFYMSDHFTSGNAAFPLFESSGVVVHQISEELVWEKKK